MSPATDIHARALLLVPHLHVQNANAISSPMTWGFPSITAFTGLMHALERKLDEDFGLMFSGVGVVCHRFDAQTHKGYTHGFRLTRNPVLKDGSTAGIVEEGRVHLEISLVFDVELRIDLIDEAARQRLADAVADTLATLRIAGGSVIAPHLPLPRHTLRPQLHMVAASADEQEKEFAKLARRLLPGFALVARDDLLKSHLAALRADAATADCTLLDAWLDLSRINYRATRTRAGVGSAVDALANESGAAPAANPERIEWRRDERPGWLVPIPVGYTALSELHPPGSVTQARDAGTPLRFVESVFSIGQWVSPHRLRDFEQLIWWPEYDEATGLYRCRNDCHPETYKGAARQPAADHALTDSLSD